MPVLLHVSEHVELEDLFVRIALFAATVAGLALGSGCSPANSPAAVDSFDRQFIDMMVPHHLGAVEMAKIAQQRAEHPEIKQLADGIIRSQEEEIVRMKIWRQSWFGSDQTPPLDKMVSVPGMSAHGGHGATMNMAADVEALRRTQEPFDLAFIEAMIPHHESAIEAAKAAETRAEKREIKELARIIIADQQREIQQMSAWRQSWYGTGHAPVRLR